MDKIVFLNSEQKDKTIELEKETLTLGRSSKSDIQLNQADISKHHANLEKIGTRYYMRDLNSSNGVSVNGTKVEGSQKLVNGDKIHIGEFSLLYISDNPEASEENNKAAAVPITTVAMEEDKSNKFMIYFIVGAFILCVVFLGFILVYSLSL